MSNGKKNNVFISHHHKDDSQVDKLTSLLKKNGRDIRNSSIRAKPANQERLDKGLIKDSVIRRLLRMKVSWAGKVIVLVGKETHSRPWVNWEIRQAKEQGKDIIGVWENGLKDKVEQPELLKKYSTAMVGWDSKSIIDALDGTPSFQNPDGSPSPRKDGPHTEC
jgi:hypothetical protein